MQSIQELPENYKLSKRINLRENVRLAVWLNVAAFGMLIPTIWLLLLLIRFTHPDITAFGGLIRLNGSTLIKLAGVVISLGIVLILHEMVHGFFFWTATKTKPVFGLQLSYAYAAAPDWFIPANNYLWIGIAPFLLLDILGVLLLIFSPVGLILYIAAAIAMNTAGSIGDLWILYTLLRQPTRCLVNDRGDEVAFYIPVR